jgi:mono/diheme cytochrome c family protein
MKRYGRHTSKPRAAALIAVAIAIAACGDGSGNRVDTAAGTVASGDTTAGATTATGGATGATGAAGAGGTTAAGGTAAAGGAAGSGQALYVRCQTCHQANGEGLAGVYPPLTGSEWVTGDAAIPIRIVLHGLQGPITVKGQSYNSVMPAYGTGQPMTDDEVAAVLTYVRSSFGNDASAVTAAEVARERAATASRTGPWTAEELRVGSGAR